MAIHNRRAEKDTTPSREYISRSRTFEENRKAHKPVQDVPDSTEDDKLNEEEETRLADLQARAERKSNKPLHEAVQNVNRDYSDNATGDNDDNNDNVFERTSDRHVKEEDKTSDKQDKEQDMRKGTKTRHKRIKIVEDYEKKEERKIIEKVEKEKEMKEREEQKEEGTEGRGIQIKDNVEREVWEVEEEESAVENEEEESKNKYDVEKLGLKSRRKIPSSSRVIYIYLLPTSKKEKF
ncbi:hypothetical protein WUBG_15638 [Wuchereria bancrofti]|uniref:Uncharacterized protein n=1 Tax=Wuchereria bancrofti TaxID=6293 RepID=J9EDG5_WUCBA|nr:hypothetical protein WUBG_15638 [Wuchereria bancrofti]